MMVSRRKGETAGELLHLNLNKQEFKGTQQLAAEGALTINACAKGLVDVPPGF
jgi:hypothetical protein